MKNLISILFILILISCKNDSLRFIGEHEFVTGSTFNKSALGGLSGITLSRKNKLFAISDDRGDYDQSRIFIFDVILKKDKFKVIPTNTLYLKYFDTSPFKNNQIDPEDIALLNDGSFYIVSEKNLSGNKLKPEIIKFGSNGVIQNLLFVPNDFGFSDKIGIRKNKGFESLTITKDQEFLFTANEEALLQDGEMANFNKGSSLRILRYKKKDKTYIYEKYFSYPLGKIPNATKLKKTKYADIGLVAMISINKNTLLTLERSFVIETKKNTAKIYKVSLNDSKNSLKKELLYDVGKIVPVLKTGKRILDNMEGMCLGPRLENGKRSLIIVSDNNFSKHQRTLFLAFELNL